MTVTEDNITLYASETSPEEKFEILEGETRQRLINMLGTAWETVPPQLEYIVGEVTRAKFNRLTDEGLSTLQTEGMTTSLREDYFKPYRDEIVSFTDGSGSRSGGRVLVIR